MLDLVTQLAERLSLLESRFTDMALDKKNIMQTIYKNRNRVQSQQAGMFEISRALCVETVDPWRQNRVSFFHPHLHHSKTPVKALPWAKPVSPFGGFDDSGVNWVPPAGSTLMIFFEHGNRETPYYLGTTWQINRGPSGSLFQYPMPEFDSVSKGHRKGYLVGPNDESQEYPPWNTENYNAPDWDIKTPIDQDFYKNRDIQTKITYPNIYGFKTPEKHMFKMVDGNAKCNRKWKRIEILSGCGNWMIFKDDHLHYGGQWAHPSCGATPGGSDQSPCATFTGDLPYFTDPHGKPIEDTSCNGKTSNSTIKDGHPSTPNVVSTRYQNTNRGSNQFFKSENECRPYKGPGTPQNNRCDLPQSGIQILSISGHTLVADDSVEEPRGIPAWERSKENFDFGCNNKFLGVFYLKSATGHSLVMSDVEDQPNLRGDKNYIKMNSAAGNSIMLNDHTLGSGNQEKCVDCPPNLAGPMRGIHLESTSKHAIRMIDHLNEQCSPCRKEGGVPTNKATKAHIQIISGGGLEMKFSDDFSQQETQSQWIQITNPQCAGDFDEKCNKERGPHFMRFQARPQGEPGVIYLRAGGHSIRQTYDMDIVLVGDLEKNPSDKFTYVSRDTLSATEKLEYRYADQHIMFAEKKILLLAGRDCPPPPDKTCWGPCVYPVIVAKCPIRCPLTGILHFSTQSVSERVFASGWANCPPQKGMEEKCTEDTEQQTIDTGTGNVVI